MKKIIAAIAATLFAAGAFAQAPAHPAKAGTTHHKKSTQHVKAKTTKHKGTQHAKRSTAHGHKAA